MKQYRKMDEHKEWMKRCPLNDFEKILLGKNIVTKEEIKKIGQNIDREIDEAFEFAKKSPLPDQKALTDYLYG
jgi:pyruvate dehydrogenase E1 component alpha subunit